MLADDEMQRLRCLGTAVRTVVPRPDDKQIRKAK